ncbi:MAG: TIGR00180 family glycosyltransferase [bacterium]|nr:TIGR00180 family glycosyltransferase [bacterium]
MGSQDKLTIITTPHYGYDLLVRFLRYYESYGFPVPILVLDSSEDAPQPAVLQKLLAHDKIRYMKFDHGTRFEEKLVKGLIKVTTPYSVISSEDDFFIPGSLNKAVEFMEKNKDYSVAHGKYIVFWTGDLNNKKEFKWRSIPDFKSIDLSGAADRVFRHLSQYEIPTFSGVHRTPLLQQVWEEAIRYTDDLRFGELLPSLITLVYGKMENLNIFYGARRGNVLSTGQTLKPLINYLNDGSYDTKYRRFKECLLKHLLAQSPLDIKSIEKVIDKAMKKNIIKSYGYPLFFFKLSNVKILKAVYVIFKKRSQRLVPLPDSKTDETAGSCPSLDNPQSEFYNDFIKIKEIVLS